MLSREGRIFKLKRPKVARRGVPAPGREALQRIGSSRMGKLSTLPNCGMKLQPVGAVS